MFGAIIRHLVFVYQERGPLVEWRAKHLANVTSAISDALPIVERYRKQVAPESEAVAKVEAVLQRSIDPANPQPGDMWSPTNPNPHAG